MKKFNANHGIFILSCILVSVLAFYVSFNRNENNYSPPNNEYGQEIPTLNNFNNSNAIPDIVNRVSRKPNREEKKFLMEFLIPAVNDLNNGKYWLKSINQMFFDKVSKIGEKNFKIDFTVFEGNNTKQGFCRKNGDIYAAIINIWAFYVAGCDPEIPLNLRKKAIQIEFVIALLHEMDHIINGDCDLADDDKEGWAQAEIKNHKITYETIVEKFIKSDIKVFNVNTATGWELYKKCKNKGDFNEFNNYVRKLYR